MTSKYYYFLLLVRRCLKQVRVGKKKFFLLYRNCYFTIYRKLAKILSFKMQISRNQRFAFIYTEYSSFKPN